MSGCPQQLTDIQYPIPGIERSEMLDREAKKRLKKIQREIKKVKKDLSKTELRPCQNDAELRDKEEDLEALGNKLRELEKEQDRYILDTGRVKHSL